MLAALLAVHIGFAAVVGCALALYALAAVMFAGGPSRRTAEAG